MVEFILKIAGKNIKTRTHDLPLHLDEAVACWLAEKFGTKEFLKEYAPKGILAIGVEGGPLDEHPAKGQKRKEGECSATLVAKALGVEDDPGLTKILKFVNAQDNNGGSQLFDLAAIVRLMGSDPMKIIDWVSKALELKYQKELDFQTVGQDEYKNALELEFQVGQRKLSMAIVASDFPDIHKVAFSRGAAIVVVQKESGNVQIYGKKGLKINFEDVARMLNIAEQQKTGEVKITDWQELSAEGIIPGGVWYFSPKMLMLLNGSLSYRDVSPTKLSLEQIVRAIKIGVDSNYLPSHCPAPRCLGKDCGWYIFGLQRCRDIRKR